MENILDRFLRYVSVDTQSNEESESQPSTAKQLDLLKMLCKELQDMGVEATLDQWGYVMGKIPSNAGDGIPAIGFIAHVDTAPDASGKDVKPQIVKDYDGKDVVLNENGPIVFSTKDFPEVLKYKGQDIMFTDGTTLLGADDKAGVTAIVSAMEYLVKHPEIKHGKIRVGFTPDEEVGRSADRFDVEKFAADFAYTIDGGELGGLEYENFNAANPTITFHGRSMHTGSAKGKMINALSVAAEWQQMLPAGEKPEYTEGYEGFYQVHKLEGGVEKCTMHMLIRDHDRQKFEARKAMLQTIADFLNAKYGEGTVEITPHDVYYNMLEKIADGNMYVVELAKQAMEGCGVTPDVQPIRGGTDGARLSFMGLPCPNIFTGGANFHGRFEYLPLESLKKAGETVLGIAVGAAALKK